MDESTQLREHSFVLKYIENFSFVANGNENRDILKFVKGIKKKYYEFKA